MWFEIFTQRAFSFPPSFSPHPVPPYPPSIPTLSILFLPSLSYLSRARVFHFSFDLLHPVPLFFILVVGNRLPFKAFFFPPPRNLCLADTNTSQINSFCLTFQVSYRGDISGLYILPSSFFPSGHPPPPSGFFQQSQSTSAELISFIVFRHDFC